MLRSSSVARFETNRALLHVLLFLLSFIAIAGLSRSARASEDTPEKHPKLTTEERIRIVTRARGEIDRVVRYAGHWMPLNGYPNGDIRRDRGACTDLVVRALRSVGFDLQRLVHEDITDDPDAYGLTKADAFVDHRRVVVLHKYFQRHFRELSTDPNDSDEFLPGDIVFFGPGKSTPHPHVGIVSDRIGTRGLRLIVENGGPRPAETDSLDRRPLIGHFRLR